MSEFDAVLFAAQQLPTADRLRLIEALWDTVPPEVDVPLHGEWAAELERRVKALEEGSTEAVPWDQVRSEALARIGHGKIR